MTKEEKLARKQQRKAEKVGLGKLLLWNSSSCSVALSTLMLGYATFYCTDVLQLAPALVGTLFMVSKIFDSFTDIVAGFIVDRTQTRWGKGRPYEIFMLFLWLSTWLLFSCPTSFATAAKCIWIFCMYTFMNSICVTFLNANNVVYMVRAFENKEQQSKIVGYGSIFTMAGAMVFNVLFPTAMAKVGTDAVGWSRLVGMIAIPLTAIGMLRILTIPEKFTPVSEKNGEQTHLKDLLPLLKESRPVLIICMVRFVQNIATGLGVGTYYWQYIIGNLGMMGVASVTTILVLPLAFALPVLRKKFGMAGMSVIGILVGCIGYLATFFAGGNMVFFIVAALLVSAGAVPLNMMFNMFIADVADYNEWKGLKRMEGTMGSLTGLAGKIGSAFGGFLMGVLMSASGYVGGADVQVDSAIMMIRVLASVAPLALMLVVAAILRFYTVDKQIHALDTTRPTTLCPSVHWLREYLDGTPYLTTDEDEWMRDDPERQKADWMHYASIFRSAVNNLPDNEKGQVYPETYIRMDEDATKNLYPYLDIAGYNYYEDRYEVLHKLHPERVLLGTETRHTMLPDTMKFAKTHPYLIGDFVWTLQSHLGEINCCDLHYEENEEHKSYPWVTNHGGVLDLTGQAEPSLHRYEFIWGGFLDKPVHALYLASQPPVHNGKPPIATSYRWTDTVDGWTYEGYEGKRTFVDAYTDADSVEIFINGKSAGKAQVKDYFAKIPCIYEPGELVGVGYDADGHEIYRTSVRTADAETVLTVKTDKNILRAGGQDFCFADVYVTDKNGTVKLLPDYDVKIEVVGAASLQGYGSAAYKNAEHYDQHHHKSWQGHLQAVLRSTEKTGPVTVTFTADGCAPAILHLSAE